MRRLIGLAYRRQFARWIESIPPELQYLQASAEHFSEAGEKRLRWLSERFPLSLHSQTLSLGGPAPLDEAALAAFAQLAAAAAAEHVSLPLSFVAQEEQLAALSAQTQQLADRCERPLLLQPRLQTSASGNLSPQEFLNRLCESSGCGLLLDLTDLWVSSTNSGLDPASWLETIDTANIRQLSISGFSRSSDGYLNAHSAPVQPALLELLSLVCALAPVDSTILERDSNFPEPAGISDELAELEAACLAAE